MLVVSLLAPIQQARILKAICTISKVARQIMFIGSLENKLILGMGNGIEAETTKATLIDAFGISN